MAIYPAAKLRNIPPGVNDPAIIAMGAILHVDAANSGSLYSYFNGPSGGIESHFFIRKDGTCLTPEHVVLTADLRWVPIGTVQVGDKLVGFDENGPHRRYQESTVEWVERSYEPTWAVVLDDGKTIYTTADHRWLTVGSSDKCNWRQTVSDAGVKLTGGAVPRLFTPWETATDFESGWFAGILDGEGSLSARHRISIAQRPTVVLDRMIKYLKDDEVGHRVSPVKEGSDCLVVDVKGGVPAVAQMLGRLRPERLLNKVNVEAWGRLRHSGAQDSANVIAVYPVGIREIVKVQTSTRTFIAEGYPMHNCEQYRDTKYEADANYHANSFVKGGKTYGYISIETQGFASGEWNAVQLAEIKKLLVWLSHTHNFPLKKCANPTDPGVGWHVMFGAPGPWTPHAKVCPGPDRVKQYNEILVPWFKTAVIPPAKPVIPPPVTPPKEDTLSAQDVSDGMRDYLHDFYDPKGTGGVYHQQEVDYRAAVLAAMQAQTDALNKLAAALTPKA